MWRAEGTDVSLRGPFQVGDVVYQSTSALRPWLGGRRLGVIVAVDGHLPPVRGDAEQLEWALADLLVGAATLTPDGGTLTVTARMRGPRVEIAIEDTGAGMPADEYDLAMVKVIVEGHGGEVAPRRPHPAGVHRRMTRGRARARGPVGA